METTGAQRVRGDAGPPGAALPWIDWIRFLAAFEVFLFHLRLYVFKPYDQFAPAGKSVAVMAWFAVTHFGGEAVLLFFALSGYLVGGGLIERVRAGTFRPVAYAIDRATRLMVPFVPALILCVALQLYKREPVDPAIVLGNLASLQGVLVPKQPYLGVDWSLAYEAWFYVLGGALAALCAVTGRRWMALALATVSFLIFSVLKADLLFCWVLGALFAQVPLRRGQWRAILLGLALCAIGIFFMNELFAGARARLPFPNIDPASWRIVMTLGVLLVLRNVVAMPGRSALVRRIDAVGTRLAAFSYSLYLFHVPVLAILALAFAGGQDMTPRALLQYGAYVVLVPAAAFGFYWLFERHTDAVRRWLKRRLAIV